ncbi:MAG: hypothetical protein ACK5HT_20640, partial [Draconibacterium sp.]
MKTLIIINIIFVFLVLVNGVCSGQEEKFITNNKEAEDVPLKPINEINDFSANLISIMNAYTNELWLYPSNNSQEYNLKHFGLANFDPITSYKLSEVNWNIINSISPKAFITGIKKDKIYISDYEIINLKYSSIPELKAFIQEFKNKDDLIIASKRDSIISLILEIKNGYVQPHYKYNITDFEVSGTCYAYKNDYNVNTEELNLQLSLNHQKGGIYIGTVRVSLSLNEAIEFFDNNKGYYTTVKIKVKPGVYREELGIAGGGLPAWTMPNLIILENPIINFDINN